jgi:hypothetical protein
MQLSLSHCPRIGPVLLMVLVIMLTASVSARLAHADAETHPIQSTGETIRNSIMVNWPPPVDMAAMKDVHVQIRFELDRAGKIVGEPKVTMTGGPQKTQEAVAASALRAVLRSAPFKNLPTDQYDTWKEVTINFAPAL